MDFTYTFLPLSSGVLDMVSSRDSTKLDHYLINGFFFYSLETWNHYESRKTKPKGVLNLTGNGKHYGGKGKSSGTLLTNFLTSRLHAIYMCNQWTLCTPSYLWAVVFQAWCVSLRFYQASCSMTSATSFIAWRLFPFRETYKQPTWQHWTE